MKSVLTSALIACAAILIVAAPSYSQSDDFKVGELSSGGYTFTISTYTLEERFEAGFNDGTELDDALFEVREIGGTYWLYGKGELSSDKVTFATELDIVDNGGTEELWLKPLMDKRIVTCKSSCQNQNDCEPYDSTGDNKVNTCWPWCVGCEKTISQETKVETQAFWTNFVGSY